MHELLAYDGVCVSYGGRTAVGPVSFALRAGEAVALAGESGSGKSTLLRAAAGLLPPEAAAAGALRYGGRDLLRLSETAWRTLRGAVIGFVFQNAGASLCAVRTVGSQIAEALGAHGTVSEDEARRRALLLFARLGLPDGERLWASRPFELSGGMQQRAALAAALLLRPRVLLADEPTGALDSVSRRAVMEALLRYREETGGAVLFVTHDLSLARRADRVVILSEGRVAEEGPAASVLAAPRHPVTKRLAAAAERMRPR